MSTIIKFDLKELRKLGNDKNSCVIEKKVTQNLALQPWCLGNLKESIKNLLDYKIGKYDKEFNGILLSYKNLKILQNVGSIRNDNADIHFQVQADYFIFRPHVGATLKGIVNKKSPTHLGILVHRVFNVVIPRPTEEPGNKWIGESVQEGQQIIFRVVVLDLYGALPYIRGELDEGSIQFEPDGDDEDYESKPAQGINVTHVNFDKTKPYHQRQIGDGLPETSKNIQNNGIKSKQKPKINSLSPEKYTDQTNNKSNPKKSKKVDSDTSTSEKSKTKRQSKILDSDIKQPESSSKQPKKHKRDI
ncbi:DNA-directed RNA polymerase I subunit RPA43 isoform X2 [Achroia grisella]|uniref:DNA-directed RNA polymerase I subunit RPA43 isoform X2 n=1 Tax=Achroia grisella TaxID=688607 RepID=UPI0027D2EF47|nr:DNA-directed RNA polymerase I subunit RPA43 isoform X2 [Achroia grisella]